MIHIAIVEDERIYEEQLEKFLLKYGQEKEIQIQISKFSDGDEIVEKYSGNYDIILMDIQMRFLDGMTAAEQIRHLDSDVIIIFITNMTEYAVKGYEVDALDYVLKPIEYFSFSRKLDRAILRIKKKIRNYIAVLTDNGIRKLDIDSILYIEIQDHTLIYHMENESVKAKGRGIMRDTEQVMAPYGFFRGNNCYLINLKWVDGMEDNWCRIGDALIQISRARKKSFMNALVEYISKEK